MKYLIILAMLISSSTAFAYTNADVNCLSKTIYYESNTQPLEGKVAVGFVVINRTYNENRPKSICAVVKQQNQFSWYTPGILEERQGNQYRALAREILEGFHNDPTQGAEYFHRTVHFRPKWTKHLQLAGVIGQHTFYRENTV